MPDRTPLRLVLDELGNPTGLAEFREGDTLPIGFVSGLGVELSTIDALLQVLVQTVGANTPPAGVGGQRHIVGTAPTGAWAGRANKLARFLDGAWQFFDARYALNAADGLWYVRSGSTWAPLAGGGGGEANTASNLGAGEGLYASKVGVDLRFKSLVAGANVTLSSDGDEITINAAGGGGGSGTVTSVALSAPTGFAVSGSPVTTTGALALAFDTGYSLPTDTNQANWSTAFGWGDHATAGYEKELTAGANITIDRTDPENPVISASVDGGGASFSPVITESTTARTLALTDAGAYIRHTNTNASTVTVAPHADVTWADDTEVHIRRAGAGNLTLAPGAGVTLNAPSGGTLVMTNAMSVTLKRVASDAWDVIGQTVAV